MADTPTQSWLRFDYFPAGRILMQQGGPVSGSLIVLKEGEVEIIRDEKFVAAIRQPGAIFGEMSVLLGRPHSATVRAVTDVQLYIIDNAVEVLEAHPSWLLQIARLLAQRVNATTAQLVALKQQAGEEEDDVLILPTSVYANWSDPQV
jgi:CRP/FNR family transcriptional regulator, cyclic AMP receptor protein